MHKTRLSSLLILLVLATSGCVVHARGGARGSATGPSPANAPRSSGARTTGARAPDSSAGAATTGVRAPDRQAGATTTGVRAPDSSEGAATTGARAPDSSAGAATTTGARAPTQGAPTADPIRCAGNERVSLDGVAIDAGSGPAIHARGNCHVELRNCTLSGAPAVDAGGNSEVTLRGCRVEGDVRATGNAEVELPESAHSGEVLREGAAAGRGRGERGRRRGR